MRKFLTPFLVLTGLILPAAAWAQSPTPVVVELFTSQGCPACPPADAYMRELARRDDVIALEFHIDFYDFGGWKDPFGSADFTRRWRNYAQQLGARYEYTPVMVVAGAAHEIGSERSKVEQRIDTARGAAQGGPRLTLATVGGQANVTVEGAGPAGVYDVVLATYDGSLTTTVTAGENRGRTLVNARVVRDFRRIGQWAGENLSLEFSLTETPKGGGCAVLLQRAGGGPIIAAVSVDFDG